MTVVTNKKKPLKKIIIHVFLALFCLNGIVAQTAQQEMQQVFEKYKSLNAFNISVQYFIYDNHYTTVVKEKALGSFQKEGEKFRSKQYGTEIIQNDNYTLVKDDSSKAMVLSKAQQKDSEAFDIQQTLANYKSIESISSKKKTQLAYRIIFNPDAGSEYEKAEVVVNAKTKLIQEIVFYYARIYDVSTDVNKTDFQQPKMRMVYTKVDTSPSFNNEVFNISKYVTFNVAGKNRLKKNYNSYAFYDQTKK